MILKKPILLVVLILGSVISYGQTSFNSSGRDVSDSRYSVSYSIGQVAYHNFTGTTGSLAEGVQQSYEIIELSGIEEAKGMKLSVSAYPIPTTDILQLEIEVSAKVGIQSLTYQLFDMNGKLLQTKELTGIQTQVDLSAYPSSTYFIRIVTKNKSIKEFKIIKL